MMACLFAYVRKGPLDKGASNQSQQRCSKAEVRSKKKEVATSQQHVGFEEPLSQGMQWMFGHSVQGNAFLSFVTSLLS